MQSLQLRMSPLQLSIFTTVLLSSTGKILIKDATRNMKVSPSNGCRTTAVGNRQKIAMDETSGLRSVLLKMTPVQLNSSQSR